MKTPEILTRARSRDRERESLRTSSAETEISLAFSSASWRINLTICWIWLETSASFILDRITKPDLRCCCLVTRDGWWDDWWLMIDDWWSRFVLFGHKQLLYSTRLHKLCLFVWFYPIRLRLEPIPSHVFLVYIIYIIFNFKILKLLIQKKTKIVVLKLFLVNKKIFISYLNMISYYATSS